MARDSSKVFFRPTKREMMKPFLEGRTMKFTHDSTRKKFPCPKKVGKHVLTEKLCDEGVKLQNKTCLLKIQTAQMPSDQLSYSAQL